MPKVKEKIILIGYVYIITNQINNKQYIGRHCANKFDESYFGSGIGIKNAVKKYGKENFSIEILAWCENYDELVKQEMYYIELFNAVKSPNFYNRSYGGYLEGFEPGNNNIAKTERCRKLNSLKHRGKKRSEESKIRQSERQRGKPSGMAGHTQTDFQKQRMSECSRHQIHTVERDSSVSKHHKGSKLMTNGIEQKWCLKMILKTCLQTDGGQAHANQETETTPYIETGYIK